MTASGFAGLDSQLNLLSVFRKPQIPGFLVVLTSSSSQRTLLGAVVVRHLWIGSSWEARRRHREAAVTGTSARRVQAQGLES